MRTSITLLAIAVLFAVGGCSQPAAAPTPSKTPAAPTQGAQATKTAEPTRAPTSQPTAVPTKATDFPQKGRAITLIVPWDAGGATDVGARLLASALEKELGTPVQVVNRPGASTQVGLSEFVKAKPDGYTMAATNLPTTLMTYLDPDRKASYGRKDFLPVANQIWDPGCIAVSADSPFKTLKDLVDAAKARPEQIKVSTTGLLTNTHLDLLMFEKATGVKFAVVHFSGGAPATTALLGGHIDASCQTAGNYPTQFKSGQVRILGIMDNLESKFFPGVKTMQEQGFKVVTGSSRGYSVPAGTPKEVVDILSQAIKRAMDTEELKQKMDEMALEQRYMDAAQYAAYWDEYEAQAKPLLALAKEK